MTIEKKDLIHKVPGVHLDPVLRPKDIPSGLVGVEMESKPLTQEVVDGLKTELTEHFVSVATDLGTLGLAEGHVDRLVDHLIAQGAATEEDILRGGAMEFYKVSKDVFGPLWTSYVDTVFSSADGGEQILFPARDATPMYWAAQGMLENGANGYKLDETKLVLADWNRWFMGQEDETDDGRKPLPMDHPMMVKFYEQMGFRNGKVVKIVEPGAWGSAANALKTVLPEQPFELWFMFSHMPDNIYGFLNTNAADVDPKVFEMINDSAEAVPKGYVRPEELIEVGGVVTANVEGNVVDSRYMQLWTQAVNQGAYDAGLEHARGKRVNVRMHVGEIMKLSEKSKQGVWTGVLPHNSLTWTEGENWRRKWPWGKIPPLK